MNDTSVLIVHEQERRRTIIKTILGSSDLAMNYTFGAKSITWAFQDLCNHTFDLVICQFTQGRENGVDLLHLMRAQEKLQAIPFILLVEEEELERAQKQLERLQDTAKNVTISTLKGLCTAVALCTGQPAV